MSASIARRGRFAAAIFLGSFLLFALEPMGAKALLPTYGGTASVWVAAVLFYQVVLLAGYAVAHLVAARLSLRAQRCSWGALALVATLIAWVSLLPPLGATPPAGLPHELSVLTSLGTHPGIPFLLLAMSGPLLQRWYADQTGAPPYRLYAVSNAGSLAGLLSYPLLVEPLMGLSAQSTAWAALVSAFALTAWLARSPAVEVTPGDRTPRGEAQPPSPSRGEYVHWVGLSAAGVMLMLGVTNRMSQDIPSTPLLWVVPLATYLATHVVAFSGSGIYRRRVFLTALPAVALAEILLLETNMLRGAFTMFTVHSIALAVGCMVCHGELARLTPHGSKATAFYLAIAAGGALGGAFVALIAPVIFTGYWELHVGWLLTYAIALHVLYTDRTSRYCGGTPRPAWVLFVGGGVVLTGLTWWAVAQPALGTIEATRTFNGVVRVMADELPGPDGDVPVRRLMHNGIVHGLQVLTAEGRTMPTAYYGPMSGVGRAFIALRSTAREDRSSLRVGAVGLGAGVIAAYGHDGDRITFYELDPEVERMARAHFTFIEDSAADVEVVIGDARLSMEREVASADTPSFDLLVIDAFTGDSVPMHLLTEEAFALYDQVLAPDGVIAMHISSVWLDLEPAIVGGNRSSGRTPVRLSERTERRGAFSGNTWILLSDSDAFLSHPLIAGSGTRLVDTPDAIAFTDQHNSLVRLMLAAFGGHDTERH